MVQGFNLRSLLGKLARGYLFAKMISLIAAHASFLIPGRRIAETAHWYALRHPQPEYPVHILIIPHMVIPDWLSFPVSNPVIYSEFVELSQQLIREEGLEKRGYRLILNGGGYQSIPQLHFHLVSGEAMH
jgi:histidine triad (HIT) family protein